jgi:hypothetical protein
MYYKNIHEFLSNINNFMKKLNEHYKRLLNEDDLGWGAETEPLAGGQVSNLITSREDEYLPFYYNPDEDVQLGDQYDPNQYGPYTPNNMPWLQDIYTNDPNFDGWNHDGWTTSPDGTPIAPKDWPHIIDPYGVHPPIPLPPGRPPNYPPHLPWPPPPGSPYYKYIKQAQETLKDGWPSWIKNLDDLLKYFEKRDTKTLGISREMWNQIGFWLSLILQVRGNAPITAPILELDPETFIDYNWDETSPNPFGVPQQPRPVFWPANVPWPPRNIEGIPHGWYQNEDGGFDQHFPAHFPQGGSIKWSTNPPPPHWEWIPKHYTDGRPVNPHQVPMWWNPSDGWQIHPWYAPMPSLPPGYEPNPNYGKPFYPHAPRY